MLRNDAEVRRYSYFELGLPVVHVVRNYTIIKGPENIPLAHHETYLHTTKVVTILIPSFQGLR